jgi:VRR-NUC domain
MAHQPEGKLVARIKQEVVKAGGRPFKIVGQDEGYQEVGIPDLLWCIRGRFVGAEVKQPGAKLRPAQRRILHEIFDAGGVAAVLETVGQAAALLAFLVKEGEYETRRGICYDRGSIRRDRCQFS